MFDILYKTSTSEQKYVFHFWTKVCVCDVWIQEAAVRHEYDKCGEQTKQMEVMHPCSVMNVARPVACGYNSGIIQNLRKLPWLLSKLPIFLDRDWMILLINIASNNVDSKYFH